MKQFKYDLIPRRNEKKDSLIFRSFLELFFTTGEIRYLKIIRLENGVIQLSAVSNILEATLSCLVLITKNKKHSYNVVTVFEIGNKHW